TTNLDKYQIYEALKDWKIYIALFIQFTMSIPSYSFAFFLPAIVNGMGFNSTIIGYVLLLAPSSSIAIGDSKRAVGGAMLIASGNIGGMIAAQIYQPQDAPTYKYGHTIATFLVIIAITLLIVKYCLLNRANKLKISDPERFLKGKNKEEAVILGDKHPSFIYSL
ncbi:13019_t:CDS:2, partial [Dentiscutata erythropus]